MLMDELAHKLMRNKIMTVSTKHSITAEKLLSWRLDRIERALNLSRIQIGHASILIEHIDRVSYSKQLGLKYPEIPEEIKYLFDELPKHL